jgi:S-adenosylmethionine hydrolase
VGGRGGGAPLITLTTDFGLTDPFVGIMKGVLATRAPGVPVVDVTHGVPPQDVVAGALVLQHATPWFPRGSVHVAVVDPGVGSARRALCIETADACFVGPDNGVLTLAAPAAARRRTVLLADDRFFLSRRSHTFDGRDVFAPVAAALATGTDAAALGPGCDDPIELELPQPLLEARRGHGHVVYVDHFGNLVTNLPGDHASVRGARCVRVGEIAVGGVARTYADVAPGAPVALVNSWGLLEIAVRDGSARAKLGVGRGTAVTVEA